MTEDRIKTHTFRAHAALHAHDLGKTTNYSSKPVTDMVSVTLENAIKLSRSSAQLKGATCRLASNYGTRRGALLPISGPHGAHPSDTWVINEHSISHARCIRRDV
jgi:hypothetical protein